jgi:hypothetical protein
MTQSMPERAMICTVWIEGIVAIAPNVGRPSRHNCLRRLSGAGFAEVKAETPGSDRWWSDMIGTNARRFERDVFERMQLKCHYSVASSEQSHARVWLQG